MQEMRQRRAEESADIDQHIEDTPADGGIVLGQRPDHRPLQAGFENRRPEGQHAAPEEERVKFPLRRHQDIADDVDGDGGSDRALIPVAVGEPHEGQQPGARVGAVERLGLVAREADEPARLHALRLVRARRSDPSDRSPR